MRPSLILRSAPRTALLALCFSLLSAAVGTWVGHAQADPCPNGPPNPPNQYFFAQGDQVYVEVSVLFDQFQQPVRSQILSGFASWTEANRTNNSRVTFTPVPPSGAPQGASIVHVALEVLRNNDGTVNTTTVARINPVRFHPTTGAIQEATIFFNLGATASDNPSSPFFNTSYYRQDLPGFDTVFKKQTEHETGHLLRLGDTVNQVPGTSVMNRAVDDCPNDNCNAQANGVQPCDSRAVSNAYPAPRAGGGSPGPVYPQYHISYENGGGTYVVYCRDYYNGPEYAYTDCWFP